MCLCFGEVSAGCYKHSCFQANSKTVIVQVRYRLEEFSFLQNIRYKLLPQTGAWTQWNNAGVCYSKSGVPGFKSATGILDFN